MGKQKLYAYVDESGQDTEGRIFVVSIVVLDNERDTVRQRLEEIEQRRQRGGQVAQEQTRISPRLHRSTRSLVGTPPPRLRRSLLRYQTISWPHSTRDG